MGVPLTVANLIDAQRQIYHLLKPITGNPAIHVPWYRWPFQIEPQRGLRYLVGNYAVMFGGLAALAICLWRASRDFAVAELAISGLYLANLLQWLVIPRSVLYYYYYYPCALLLSLALVVALARWERKTVLGVRLDLIPVIAAIGIFLFSYPQMAGLGPPWDSALGYWR
jgi:dolichyl-phosphate-mannose--protein O-mannosyl transferase